ncbi:aromatic ring-hydroxylating oxygenase subunit alpha [Novosphingobium album (ex Liu et al. 2023)]|uniref:Aromatic ring-hydroxylating dioxygenase subunit alpha n=1 Tax=Novosphingobium album (ex Liu et al. 2023) TaxID=3031130 RepID=A0ABT5WMM7_9SPHN|nr:aromatic ring-hydroxylating dioxygenase subunit alpha [Novosphingobium album (ex Liu et al. 2023)]MDE8651287.1 aromatic ring-hydroxylating dioxygenase subunit alpha [Novosphingobium album (ex Liu et al. 2023)]
MNKPEKIVSEELSEPLTFPVDAYVSREYAEAEADRLWSKVWQQAGRVEEIPQVGNYITYNIGHDSILIVRADDSSIKAFHNVCPHRGRRLVANNCGGGNGVLPQGKGEHSACGRQGSFVCPYHAWTFDLDGKATYILDKEDWQGTLTPERTGLTPVKVDTWGGWIFINMDPEAEPLRDYLEPIATLLDPFEFDRMRYRFRFWGVFDCNWKVALEAFLEPYHVAGTHPQLCKYGDFYAWSKALGLHGNDGYDTKEHKGEGEGTSADTSVHRAAKGEDARVSIARMQQEFWDTIGAGTSETLVKAAQRLVDELPEGTPPADVHHHWIEAAKRDDAARGVPWPEISDAEMATAGLAQSVFPNMNLLPGPTFLLYYRVRPYGTDPDKCIYEAVALDRFPEGEEPKTEWTFAEQDLTKWPHVIAQDISNMVEVQRGLKSRGFRGNLPNPWQERKVTNLHRGLAKFMGTGRPVPLD